MQKIVQTSDLYFKSFYLYHDDDVHQRNDRYTLTTINHFTNRFGVDFMKMRRLKVSFYATARWFYFKRI